MRSKNFERKKGEFERKDNKIQNVTINIMKEKEQEKMVWDTVRVENWYHI